MMDYILETLPTSSLRVLKMKLYFEDFIIEELTKGINQ